MITIQWLGKEQTQLKWTFSGKWTGREYYQMLAKSQQMILSQTNDIDIILDLRAGNTPENLSELARGRSRSSLKQVKQVVIMGYAPTWKSIHSILRYMMDDIPVPIQFVSQLSDLEKQDDQHAKH